MKWSRRAYTIDMDKNRLQLDQIHQFLRESYWAADRSRETIAHSLETSLCFGIYQDDKMVGFARVVTDYTTFYWLCDVFVDESQRGSGLGKWLMECIVEHPQLKDLLGVLATSDAHGLYEQYGFVCPEDPCKFMWKRRNV